MIKPAQLSPLQHAVRSSDGFCEFPSAAACAVFRTNAFGHAVILCAECGVYVEHERVVEPEDNLDGWVCCVCDEYTRLDVAEARDWRV